MLFFIEGWSRGMTEREINESRSRRPACLHYVQGAAQAEGWDTGSFEMTRDQTHGLMANWSHRYEKGRVDILRPVGVEHRWCKFLAHPTLRVDPAHT